MRAGNDRGRAISQTYGPSFAAGADLSIFTARLTDLPDNVEEDINRAQIDYVKKFTGLAVPFEIKAGGDWRNQARDQEFKQPTWAYVGPDGVAGTNPATGINDDNLNRFRATVGRGPFNGFYPPFNRVSLAALDEACNQIRNGSGFPLRPTRSRTSTRMSCRSISWAGPKSKSSTSPAACAARKRNFGHGPEQRSAQPRRAAGATGGELCRVFSQRAFPV